MLTDKRLLQLASDIYEAAIDPSSWQDSLTSICDVFSSDMAAIVTQDNASGVGTWSRATGIDSVDEQRYTNYYGTISPNFWQLHRTGDVITDEMHANRRAYINSEIYNDYFKPLKLERNASIVLERTSRDQTYLCLRRPNKRIYTDSDIQAICRFTPHLYRAIKIQRRIQFEDYLKNAVSSVLDQVESGIIFLTSGGEVINLNLEAERILANGDGLYARNNHLYINQNGSLVSAKTLFRWNNSSRSKILNPTEIRVVVKRALKRPYILASYPLIHDGEMRADDTGMAVFITDPEKNHDLDIQTIRELFGLTKAEARLAIALSEGKSLAEYGSEANITTSTARSTLKVVFKKTQTSRQAELVKLILSCK